MSPGEAVAAAILRLIEARDLLKLAGARKTVARVRLALSSAKGAQRHADHLPYRAARGARGAR